MNYKKPADNQSISFFNKNNEITAVKSSGLSMARFFTPLIILGAAISVFAFLLSNFVAVRSNVLRRVVMQKDINKNKNYNEGSVYKYTTKNIFHPYGAQYRLRRDNRHLFMQAGQPDTGVRRIKL